MRFGSGLWALGSRLQSTVRTDASNHRAAATDASAPASIAILPSLARSSATPRTCREDSPSGVAFPRQRGRSGCARLERRRVLPVGAQSSLTGGATPRGELVLSTRALSSVGPVLADGPTGSRPHDPRWRRRTAHHAADDPDRIASLLPARADVRGRVRRRHDLHQRGGCRDVQVRIDAAVGDGHDCRPRQRRRAGTPARRGHRFSGWHLRGRALVGRNNPVHRAHVSHAGRRQAVGRLLRNSRQWISSICSSASEGTLGVIVEATLRVIPRPRRAVTLIRCDDDRRSR